MSAFDNIKKLFVHTSANLRGVSSTEAQAWFGPGVVWDENDEEYDYPGHRAVSFFFKDDGTISRIESIRCHSNRILPQLRHGMRLVADILCDGGWYDLEDLKLNYRKVGKLVEVDVVSYCTNWGDNEGPALQKVEATFVYDPTANALQAK